MANIRSFKELRVWQNAMDDLDQRYEQILGQLVTMIENPDDWVVGAKRSPRVSASPSPRVS
jgi:hypothetical protein